MKTMTRAKRTAEKPMTRVRKLSTATKILITGNGSSEVVGRVQKDLDSLLADMQNFNETLWKLVHHNKARLYRFLDMLYNRNDATPEGPFLELKQAWSRVASSASTVGHDVQLGARQLRRKTQEIRANSENGE